MCPGSGAGPGAFGPPAQPPGGATPSSHQPVMGLAQAQTNNSNNKTGTYAGAATSVSEYSLPEDLHQLMEDWAQEVLVVTQRPHSNSLSISRKDLWDQAVPHTHRRQRGDSEVCDDLLHLLHACKTEQMDCCVYVVHLKQLKVLDPECSVNLSFKAHTQLKRLMWHCYCRFYLQISLSSVSVLT